MKYVVVAVIVVLVGLTCLATNKISLTLYPDGRAPSVALSGINGISIDGIDLALNWSAGAWTYIGPPPTGYGSWFFVLKTKPVASYTLDRLTIGGGIQVEYRTNLPDRVLFHPEIFMSWAW